jgi:hypothetical protein
MVRTERIMPGVVAFISDSGHRHVCNDHKTRDVFEMMARVDLPPVPALAPFRIGYRKFVWIGRAGVHPIDLSSETAFRESLARATQRENLVFTTATVQDTSPVMAEPVAAESAEE